VAVGAATVVGQRRWGQTDIRGLGTARRWFGANGGCSLGTGVTPVLKGILLWLIAVTQIQFAYLAADRLAPIKLGGGS
jgi:hypothetical protein